MTVKYKLVGRELVIVEDLIEWATAMEQMRRDDTVQIGHDMVGKIEVSTIFLGLDFGMPWGPPRLFETMTFEWPGGAPRRPLDTWRYTTLAEAEAGHAAVVAELKAKANPQ
jgi:hypothetical protein